MFNSDFTLLFDKAYENVLVFGPVLNDISLRWVKTAETDVVLEVKTQPVSQFVFV